MNQPQPDGFLTPLPARIRLSHAYFQRLADINKIDILHVKGYAFGTDTYPVGRISTDVDILVHPAHVHRLMYVLKNDGWEIMTHFNTGSIFEHASTVYHPAWGLADIHKYFPGIGSADALATFLMLWKKRRTKEIAHYPCQLPSLVDAQLIVVTHGARAISKPHPDVVHLQKTMDDAKWRDLRKRADQLNSLIAFDTALGKLEQHRNNPDYLMWKVISEETSVFTEWRARLKFIPGLSNKLRILWQIISVNEDHLAMTLGHEPTRQEKRRKFFERFERILL